MGLTHSCDGVSEKNILLPTDHFSQNPLFIGRFHHLAFENHLPESEILVVREGKKACDVNLAETQVRKSTVLGSSQHPER